MTCVIWFFPLFFLFLSLSGRYSVELLCENFRIPIQMPINFDCYYYSTIISRTRVNIVGRWSFIKSLYKVKKYASEKFQIYSEKKKKSSSRQNIKYCWTLSLFFIFIKPHYLEVYGKNMIVLFAISARYNDVFLVYLSLKSKMFVSNPKVAFNSSIDLWIKNVIE